MYFSQGQRNSKGVMLLINSNFDPNVQIVQTDHQGRLIILNMLLDNKQIKMIQASFKIYIRIYQLYKQH